MENTNFDDDEISKYFNFDCPSTTKGDKFVMSGADISRLRKLSRRLKGKNRGTHFNSLTNHYTAAPDDARIYNISDFIALDLPDRKNLLDPWLPEKGLAMVFSQAGVGKTFFALNVAYAVATGGSFLGWSASESSPVLYIDGEMSAKTMQDRLRAINGGPTVKEDIPFQIITPELFGGSVTNLTDFMEQKSMSDVAANAKLIVIDNVACLFPTGNENESDRWYPVQSWLLNLKKEGKTVLLVHHASKTGGQRGTSAHLDVLDTAISLTHSKSYVATQGAAFKITFVKSRGFYGDDAKPFSARLITQKDGAQDWVTDDTAESDCHAINQTYENTISFYNEGLAQKDIASRLGKSRGMISQYVSRARKEGRLTNTSSAVDDGHSTNKDPDASRFS